MPRAEPHFSWQCLACVSTEAICHMGIFGGLPDSGDALPNTDNCSVV